jgi:phenylpropionate dioxygenase-like ring-hydroxylating dioxygenase large terminal subunit
MPSTTKLNVKIKALPCFEQEGMIWVWPGTDPPKATIPSLLPPPGFRIHAEVACLFTAMQFSIFKPNSSFYAEEKNVDVMDFILYS